MLAFLRLIRLPNLLILAFTGYMLRWALLKPVLALKRADLDYSLLDTQITELDYFLLILSMVMIAAAGYIINDYFDVRIDEVNRPTSNVIDRGIKRRVAMGAHMVINFIGAGLGIYLSWKYNQFRPGTFIYITAPALLWFYSTNLKRQLLIGNIVIALLSGLVPLLIMLFELPAIYYAFPDLVNARLLDLSDVFMVAKFYALFAFLISLIREIIKDTEDYEGDMKYGCRTLPIVAGISTSKYVIIGLTMVLAGILGWLQWLQYLSQDWMSFGYFTLLLEIPLIYLMYRVYTAVSKKDWWFSSLLVKLIMLSGISFLFLYSANLS